MTTYIILPNAAAAEVISRGLYRLARPLVLAEAEGDSTLYAVDWIKHQDGRAALELLDDLPAYPRHPDVATQLRDPRSESRATFAQLMGGLVGSQEDGAAIQAYVIQNPAIDLMALVPRLRADLVKTEAEMEADGWPIE